MSNLRKVKLVVFNEHTLGYILPELPKYVQPLKASILKGATFETHSTSKYINSSDTVRLASEKDFNDFGVYMGDGYKNKAKYNYGIEYEYAG